MVLSGGSTAVVAGAAGGISFAVDASDSLSSEVGIQDGELGEFAGNALLTAATAYGMGKLFHALKLGKFKMTEHATTTGTEHGIHGLVHPHGAEHPIMNAANLRNLSLRAI